MKKFLVCAVLASAATSLHAAILYTASIGCGDTCITVSLSWAAEMFPVNYASVEDNDDNFLFALNLGPSAGLTTGAIVPYPQTISPLNTSQVATIRAGQAYLSLSEMAPGAVGGHEDHETQDGTPFIADVPEPATWFLTAAGLASLLLFAIPRGARLPGRSLLPGAPE